jgi:hypothetical protein
MGLAFLPIDIDARLPDEERVIQYCHDNHLKLPGFGINFEFVPVISRLDDAEWNDKQLIKETLSNRYNVSDKKSKYYKDIDKIFPEIPYMVEQLPFKEITFAALLLQKKYVDHHMDTNEGDTAEDPYEISIENEPHRYNIQLTQHTKNKFFMSQEINGEKTHRVISKERPCFVFSERYYWHGGEYEVENCVHFAIMAIVDRVKHKDMIIKNLIKYHNEAIIYPDPIDPWDPKYQSQYDANGNDIYNT